MNLMMGRWLMIVKTLVKSSLDNYVLPGTLTGTEILLVYVYQWKRNISFVTMAALSFVFSHPERFEREESMIESCESAEERCDHPGSGHA